MREFFSQFGKVIDSTVMLDRETGRSKGFGFISFEDTDVRPFLGFGNLEIDGKLVSPDNLEILPPLLTIISRSTSNSPNLVISATVEARRVVTSSSTVVETINDTATNSKAALTTMLLAEPLLARRLLLVHLAQRPLTPRLSQRFTRA